MFIPFWLSFLLGHFYPHRPAMTIAVDMGRKATKTNKTFIFILFNFQMGFDGLFFGRLDYQDKNHRLNTTTMEMVWHGSPNNLGR